MTHKKLVSAAVAIMVILLSQIGWECWSGKWDYAPFHDSIYIIYNALTTFSCARVQLVLDAFPNINFILVDNVFHFCDGRIVGISNGCSGLKQYFHFLCLILCSLNGAFLQKVFYILLGIIVLINFNILRISILCVMMDRMPEYWEFFHSTIFRFAFYVIILLLWILWEESRWLSGSSLKKKENDYC